MQKGTAPWWAREGVRYRLVAAPAAPLVYDLPDRKSVTVTYEELAKHAGGREVAAVSCLSRSFTGAVFGGQKMPDVTSIYTGSPRLITLWPGDAVTFTAAKSGGVELTVMLPVYVEG